MNTFATHFENETVFEIELHIHFGNALHKGESVYLIGSLNQWHKNGLLLGEIPSYKDELIVTLKKVPAGDLEFRLTRGQWYSVNCNEEGTIVAPFLFNIQNNTSIDIEVEAWRDDFPASTATEQVHTLSDQFYLPTLNAYRKVWIYLPKSYTFNTSKHYPVMYMHDGQHLFDEAAAVGRKGPVEWQVDKVINASSDEAIVVAIAHGGEEKDRLKDYVVMPVNGMAEPLGKAYLHDVVHSLKPYVDKHYRTLHQKENTGMAGSSLGGLLSLYAGIYYPNIFSCFGVFSPSLWLDANAFVDEFENQFQEKLDVQYYIYGGGLENRKIKDRAAVEMDKDIENLVQQIQSKLNNKIEVSIDPHGKHGALYWQKAFPAFYKWWQEKIK